jgi:hypothetical protein
MGTQNVSRLEKHGAPSSVRGLWVAALAFFLIAILILIRFSWASWGGVISYSTLAFLGILALVSLVVLVKAWKYFVSPRQ